MLRGEIHLAMFPFGDAQGMKLRPVLLLTSELGAIPEVRVAYISSVVPSILLPTDLILDPSRPEHAPARLKVIFVLWLHKLATIHRSALARRLGKMPPILESDVTQRLKHLLGM